MKRFYKEAAVSAAPFRILLDGKPVKTPAKVPLQLPTAALAEAVAAEWRAQGDEIDPNTMPLTKLANTAIDRVEPRPDTAVEQVMAFVNDLLCYRAERPSALSALQTTEWDPLLAWVTERFGARLRTRPGLVHFDQPAASVAALTRVVEAYDAFSLTALAAVAPVLGSLVLSLALAESRLTAEEAFALSQLDERYQAERWGKDKEAEQRAAGVLADVKSAETFLRLARKI